MKSWRLLLAVALAVAAVLLMAGLVAAAPPSTTGIQTGQVFDSPILTDTTHMTHPVGLAIALYFNIPYAQVMSLRAQGFGFGAIARAYLTARASNGMLTPEQALALRQAGVGWGQIKKNYGVHPGGNGLGSIMSQKSNTSQREPDNLAPPEAKPNKNASSCPGNSCSAPGQQKPHKGKPSPAP